MAIGVSYFGNRILRHVTADMDDLAARGFTGVLHTFSENDFFYYRQQIAEMVAVSHRAGLSVQVNPWGLGHMFGGEAESRFTAQHPEVGQVMSDGRRIGAGCPSNPRFRDFVREWASAAVETGADHVFWDEPHWAHPERFSPDGTAWGCRCEHCLTAFAERTGHAMPAVLDDEVQSFREAVLVDFLREMVAHVDAVGGRSTVCLLPLTTGPMGLADWESVAALPGLDVIATDPYWQAFDEPVAPFVTRFSQRIRQLAEEHDLVAQIWIQGFGLGPEDAEDIRTAVTAARQEGIEDLWTWGYEACGHMPGLRTREPQRVWQILCETLTQRPPEEPDAADLSLLGTEQVRPELQDLDLWSTSDVVALLAREHVHAAQAVVSCSEAMEAAVDAIAERFARGGRLIYAGAGTAGRLGVLEGVELRPTFGTAADRVVAVLAGGTDRAVGVAAEGAEDDRHAGDEEVTACGIGPDDVLIAISASGRTPYALGAVDAAVRVGALSIGVAGNRPSLLGAAVDHPIEVPAGPEAVAGSTRLKAGTAQKAVLNTLSTAAMVRIGKTYGNLMVDVQATNGKLWDRARRIVTGVADVDEEQADAALRAADGHAKTAIAALVRGVQPDEARRLLDAAGGRLRAVLEG